MKKTLTLLAMSLSVAAAAQAPVFDQALYYKGSNSSYILDVVTDMSGNTFAAGYFYGDLTLGQELLPGSPDFDEHAFVLKVNHAGELQWTRHITGQSRVYAMERDNSGNVYIAGFFRETLILNGVTYTAIGVNDIFVAKLNAQGNTVWFRQMGGSADEGNYYACSINDLARDQSGNIYFTGFFTDSLSFQSEKLTSLGRGDVVTGKLNSNGDLQWWTQAGGTYGGDCGLPNNDNGAGIAVDKDGAVYITGHYAFNLHIGGQVINANHNVDIYVAKYDTDGNFEWAQSAGGLSWEMGTSLACDNAKNVYVSGHFKETFIVGGQTYTSVSQSGSQYDIFILKYDTEGNLVWARQEGATRSEYAYRLVTDYADNFYIAGTFDGETELADSSISGLPSRCFIAKYNSAGVPQYLAHGGGAGNNPQALALDYNNDLVLGGFATAHPSIPLQFGNISVTPTGNYLFLTRLNDPVNSTFGLDKHSDLNFSLYPNPMLNEAQLQFQNPDAQPHTLLLFNIQGQLVQSWPGISSGNYTIQRGQLPAGVYVYQLRSGGETRAAGRLLLQ